MQPDKGLAGTNHYTHTVTQKGHKPMMYVALVIIILGIILFGWYCWEAAKAGRG